MAKFLPNSTQATLLLDPNDNMDVRTMVRYHQAVRQIGTVPFDSLPVRFRQQPGSEDEYKAVTLYGEVCGCLCALIVGHHGLLDEEGTHMSVTELLQTGMFRFVSGSFCSCLTTCPLNCTSQSLQVFIFAFLSVQETQD